MLAGDDGPLDHENVEARVERDLVVAQHALGRQRRGADDSLGLDLADPLGDQLLLDGLAVDLLHLARSELLGQRGDPLELLLGVLVAGEDPFEVEDPEAAEVPDDARRRRRDHPVHRAAEHRQLEAVVTELPGDVDVVGVAGAPRGHDRDVVEAVSAPCLLAAADLYFHFAILGF